MNADLQFKKMTETPVIKLVLKLALPTTVSMLVTSIYNMADTYFVSDIGNSASGAIGVVFALMAIIQAFGFTFGHGAGSNISRLLGAKNIESAREYATTSVVCAFLCGVILAVFGLIFQEPLMTLLGSTPTILPYAKDYSRFILIGAPMMMCSCALNNILRYEGKATYSMIGLVSGGVLNIFGDFYLIKVLDMGVMGAGLATCCSQCVSVILLLIPFLRGQIQSRLSFKYLPKSWRVPGSIVLVGLPSMMRQGLNSISTMILNKCSGVYGDEAIAAMSIVTKIISLVFCIGIGIGQGFQPVSSFNYGAKKYGRVRKAFIFTVLLGTVTLFTLGIVTFVFAEEFICFFRNDAAVVEFGVVALRVQSCSMIFLTFTLCSNMLFQSIGKSGYAILLASMRSGLIFIPVLLILSFALGRTGIQIAQAVSDCISFVAAMPIVVVFLKKLKRMETELMENEKITENNNI